ncbi:MAG: phosphate ABC transporter substrate-binding protein PstS [Candidatus Terraquivivens tikiterensis]|uniref:Phosphate-binding protein n=1 Tax=Candidatus Terraquivivens tikiterensis TaxID=1980982 RepID=A0A2R7Y590_9ARCH|nr:MAG: phosphate ABC transporter substrate-binding protein PstS [Candidatus Terraquivivens tikiterensis]
MRKRGISKTVALFSAVAAVALIAAVAALIMSPSAPTPTPTEAVRWPEKLLGGGATFVNPLMQKWAYEFKQERGLFGVDYQSIGSGQGIAKLKEQAVDFATSDSPLKRSDWEGLRNIRGGVIQIPITVGSVVAVFNVPGVEELRLPQEAVLKIFDGSIKKWNDPRLVELNPQLRSVDMNIIVVYRADRSGTTSIWTDFLEKVSGGKFPRDFSFKLPEEESDRVRFIGAKGNEGVTEAVRKTQYSIGYVELSYAVLSGLSHAAIQNKAGNFVKASAESVADAVKSVIEHAKLPGPLDDWSEVSLIKLEPPDPNAYPVVSFSYVLLYVENPPERAAALREFLTWIYQEGQKQVADVPGYVPLPENALQIGLMGVSYIKAA